MGQQGPAKDCVMEPLSRYVSLKEFSRLTGLSLTTLRRRVKDGSLPCKQLGGRRCRLLIPRDALETLDKSVAATSSDAELATTTDGSILPATTTRQPLPGPRPRWTQQRNI